MIRLILIYLIALYLFSLSQVGFTQRYAGRSSLCFRAGFWHPIKSNSALQFTSNISAGKIETDTKGSFTTGIDFFHWMNDNLAFGLTLGMMGHHEGNTLIEGGFVEFEGSSVESYSHQVGMVPLHLGVRLNLLPYWESVLRPYVAAGGGIYWGFEHFGHKIVGGGQVESSNDVKSESIPGGYLGGGADLVISRKGLLAIDFLEQSALNQGLLGSILGTGLAFNIDYRYHFIRSEKALGGQKYWSGSEITFGLAFLIGKPKTSVKVEKIELITSDIYPAFYKYYADFPIGWVSLKNTTRKLVEARVALHNDEYMNYATYTDFLEIPPKSVKTFPVTAVFNEKITQVQFAKPATINFIIEARTIDQFRFTKSTKCVIHSRNGWNGDVSKLRFFVTPDESRIMNLTRSFLKAFDESVQSIDTDEVYNLKRARMIFNHLSRIGMSYEHDPNLPYYKNDYVQYPVETLDRKTGDCDDLAVLYASMLESVGIRTAFIDVRSQTEDSNAHVYLMFDSGVPPDQARRISSNEKKYIVREIDTHQKSLWIPIETTLMNASFEKAWEGGALDYLREVVINRGIENGQVKIVDVE